MVICMSFSFAAFHVLVTFLHDNEMSVGLVRLCDFVKEIVPSVHNCYGKIIKV
jgi:hypothetical protein